MFRTGFDLKMIKFFGDVRVYTAASVTRYGSPYVTASLRTKLLDCRSMTMENYPGGPVVSASTQPPEYRTPLLAEFKMICDARPAPAPRPLGESPQ
jgi:hypothetical protein